MAAPGKADRSVIDIMEEAVYLLKTSPFSLAPYYVGSLPFILGLLFFWVDMSSGADAWRHRSQAAWTLSLLFVWMKTWQGVYCRGLLSSLRGGERVSWGPRRFLRTAAFQTAIQPWGTFLLPLALVVMLPFPRLYAFFQNCTLLGSGDEPDLGSVIRESWYQAGFQPMQNALLIWLGSPFLLVLAWFVVVAIVPVIGMLGPDGSTLPLLLASGLVMVPLSPLSVVLSLNLAFSMFIGPQLLHSLLGIDTILSMNKGWIANDAFFVVLCGLVYLCLDPLLKACYCLRCFYGASVKTGADLKAELRALRKPGPAALLLVCALLGLASPACLRADTSLAAARQQVSAAKLDAAIDRTIRLPKYEWRMPREKPPASQSSRGALRAFLEPVMNGLKSALRFCVNALSKLAGYILDLLLRIMPAHRPLEKTDKGWTSFSRLLVIGPLACIVGVFAFLGWKMWKGRRRKAAGAQAAAPVAPDIAADDVDVSALPEDGWMEMAKEMMEKGELRLSLRALYLATLAFLARERLITLERYKSDREYDRELRGRLRDDPVMPALFTENRGLFERTWYGLHDPTPDLIDRFRQNQERMKTHGQS